MCACYPKHRRGTAALRPFLRARITGEWWGGSGGYPPREGGRALRALTATEGGAGPGYRGRRRLREDPGYPGPRGRRRQPGYRAADDGYVVGGGRARMGPDDGYVAGRRRGP